MIGEELEQALVNFASDWQAGDATDLQGGLQQATAADPGRPRSGAAVRSEATTANATTAAAAIERGARRASPARRRQTRKRYLLVLLFMSPWIVGFVAFTLYPMLSSLYFSFTSYDLLSTPHWIGIENYRFMFTKDPLFWTAIKNTAWIIVVGVPAADRGRHRHGLAARASQARRQGLSHACSSCRRWPRRSRPRSRSCTCSTRRSGP